MMKRWLSIGFLALCALLSISCVKEKEGEEAVSGERGSLVLFVNSGKPSATKADDLSEGLRFKNLLVVIANDGGTVVVHELKEDLSLSTGGVTRTTVDFQDLRVGSYHVYAYANIDHTAWQTEQTIRAEEGTLVEGQSTVTDSHRQLAVLTGTSTPVAVPDGTGMLLTGHQEVLVGAQDNVADIELLRPVSRLNVHVYNDTPYQVTLKSLSFHDINPSHSYILNHWDQNGIPLSPEGTEFRAMPPLGGDVLIHPAMEGEEYNGHQLVYSQLMYEGASTNTYRMFASLELEHTYKDDNGVQKTETKTAQLTEQGIHLLTYKELSTMPVDTKIQVLMFSPNGSNGGFVGFNGESKVRYEALHTLEENYWRDAKRGILADATNRPRYLLTLEKVSASQFKIYKDATHTEAKYQIFNADNGACVTATLEEGTDVGNGWHVSMGFDGALLRFRTDYASWSSNNYLKIDGSPKWATEDSTRGCYQWALYGIDLPGCPLNVIDHETEQVSRLTYMRRNMELNVIMNVYYAEDPFDVHFQVDNAWWTEGHQMQHMFN